MTKRLALVRISQETHAFSPIVTEIADFDQVHRLEGEALRAACQPRGVEVPGLWRGAELSGALRALQESREPVEVVPLFSSWAIPGGPLSAQALSTLRQRLRAALLGAGWLDGLLFSLHGAMSAQGEPEPEARLLEDARALLGPQVPIVATLDLHAALSPAKLAPLAGLAAYHTNPHRDHRQTGERAGRMLLAAVCGQARLTTAWRPLPMTMGGGITIDLLAPMRSIFRRVRQLARQPGVLSADIFLCHPWSDHPALGWSVHVVTRDDQALADRIADELAARCWAVRDVPTPAMMSAAEGIDATRRSRLARATGTVLACDASDVVGAGGTGENTHLLRAVLERAPDLRTFLPLRDAVAVDHCFRAGEGTQVSLPIGGRLQPDLYPPLPVTGRVERCVPEASFGRTAVLAVAGVRVVLTERAPLAMRPAFFREVGLEPWRADLVVSKTFFPFRIYFMLEGRRTLYIKTRGLTDFDWGAQARLQEVG